MAAFFEIWLSIGEIEIQGLSKLMVYIKGDRTFHNKQLSPYNVGSKRKRLAERGHFDWNGEFNKD